MNKLLKKTYNKLYNTVSYPQKKNSIKGGFIILNFHQVSENFNKAYHDNGTWTNIKTFVKLINKINNEYGIVPLKNGVERLSKNEIKNDIVFSLTFDDGDISLKDNVIPFLSEKNIPATFFINTNYLDNQTTNWVRAYKYLISINHNIVNDNLNFENLVYKLRNTNNLEENNNYILAINDAYSKLEIKPIFTLSSEDLNQIDSKLFNLGLHGHEHQRYSMLTYEEQKADIEKNIIALKGFTNYVPYFAIPFGTKSDWDRNTVKLALEKDLLLFYHTNAVNFSANSLGLDRIPCDGKNFKKFILNLKT